MRKERDISENFIIDYVPFFNIYCLLFYNLLSSSSSVLIKVYSVPKFKVTDLMMIVVTIPYCVNTTAMNQYYDY